MLANYPDWSLQHALHNAIEIWGDSRRDHWKSGDEKAYEHVYDAASEAARTLLRSGETLVADDRHELGMHVLHTLARFDSRDVLMESLDEAVAYHLNPQLRAKSQRILDLAALVTEERPPASVSKYLRNVSRCYVLGLAGEAIVMCRAVLENALICAFDTHGIPRPDGDLETRIKIAAMRHVLDSALESAAQDVRRRGNKAVHHDPDVTQDVLGAVRSTMCVLADLQRRQP